MALEKLKGIFGSQEPNEEIDSMNEYVETRVNSAENTMILLEPRAYSESQQIADYLKNGSSVVVNLKRVTPDQYAISGDLQKLGGGIFLCTPRNVNVEGKISDEAGNSAKVTKNNKSAEEAEEDEFNW